MLKTGKITGGPDERAWRQAGLDVMQEVLVEAGQRLTGRLAALTAPMTREQGQRAVARDVTALFGGKVRVASILKKESRGKAAAWLQAIEQGAGKRRIRSILKGTSLADVAVLSAPDPEMHRQSLRQGRRKRQGRKRPKAIVSSRDAVKRFIEERQGNVWMARKGWWDAGQALGAPGGGQGPSGATVGGARVRRDGLWVSVEVTNEVRHAQYLMSYRRRQGLVEEQRQKAIAELRKRMA